jgi:hypothetical protein
LANSARRILLAALLGAALVARAQDEPSLGGYKLSEFPAPGAAPVFRPVSPGEEPRRALRYRLVAGSLHKLVMTMRMSLGVEVDGRSGPVQRAPAMRMVFDCRVTEADERQARFDFGLSEPPELFETEGVPAAMLEPMKKSLSALSLIRGHVAMTNRGVVREAKIEVGQGLDQGAAQMVQSMRQSMEQTSVPLPEESVGVGARWRMLHRVEGGGVIVYQMAEFAVVRFEGAIATLSVTIEQFAPKQDMALPAAAGNAKAELASMTGRGEGYLAVDLTSPVPRSSAEFDTTLRMNILGQDRTLQMGMRNRMKVQVEPGTP